ncbi:MAG: damage-control phosphatase ARMT1 family protein [Armatimonadota bacterium]
MTTAIDCLPCLVRQAIDTTQRIGMSRSTQEALMQEVLYLLSTLDMRQPAPIMGQRIHQLIRMRVGNDDPYRTIKAESNALALEWFPRLQAQIRAANDPLALAIRAAIAGNIIDYGAKRQVDRQGIEATLTRALAMSLEKETLTIFREALANAGSILYLADNAGEIVFDRLLIECLPREKVTLVVRGAPVINDATHADAATVGLGALVEVMDNGSDIPGTVVDQCAPAFQQRFATADVIIAKGQGNFETLVDAGRPIFHLFIVKCPMVATLVGCPMDTPVFQYRK